MYIILTVVLLTDKGKVLLRSNKQKYDVHRIHKELATHTNTSKKASIESSILPMYTTSITLGDGKWRNSMEAFILHW